jgi:hypothetical protein
MNAAIRKKVHHFNLPGQAHELTFSCYRRLPLLSRDRTRRWIIESIEAARKQRGFAVLAFVIMPEHAHLIVYLLRQMIEYIHNNPVRRGLVDRAVDWPWSSACWYERRECILEMDLLP